MSKVSMTNPYSSFKFKIGATAIAIGLIGEFIFPIGFLVYYFYTGIGANEPLLAWPWNRSAESQELMGWFISIIIMNYLILLLGRKLLLEVRQEQEIDMDKVC